MLKYAMNNTSYNYHHFFHGNGSWTLPLRISITYVDSLAKWPGPKSQWCAQESVWTLYGADPAQPGPTHSHQQLNRTRSL